MVRSDFAVVLRGRVHAMVGHPTLESAMRHSSQLTGPHDVLECRNEIVVHKSVTTQRQGEPSSVEE